jgi:hypothetical protein
VLCLTGEEVRRPSGFEGSVVGEEIAVENVAPFNVHNCHVCGPEVVDYRSLPGGKAARRDERGIRVSDLRVRFGPFGNRIGGLMPGPM